MPTLVVDGGFTFEINRGLNFCNVLNCSKNASIDKTVRVTIPNVGTTEVPVCSGHYHRIQKMRIGSSLNNEGRCPSCNRNVPIVNGRIECKHGKE